MSIRDRLEYAAVRGSTAFAVALSRVLSLRALLGMAGAIGRGYARLAGPRVDVARINLARAFPDWSKPERERVLVDSFASYARSIAEWVLLQGPHREALLSGVRFEGESVLREALATSPTGGAVALTAHFGSWELGGAAAASLGVPLCVVHRSFENELLEQLLRNWRESAGLDVVALGRAGFGVLRALRRGKVVAMLVDQDAKRSEAVFAPFFSHLASTRSGPVHIAMATNAPVLPVAVFRDPARSGGHVIRIFPPLEFVGVGEEEEQLARNVALMNAALEDVIRLAPDHWMWAHRRWRTQPEGAPRVYPSRHGRSG